jgi:hypothetical protein
MKLHQIDASFFHLCIGRSGEAAWPLVSYDCIKLTASGAFAVHNFRLLRSLDHTLVLA